MLLVQHLPFSWSCPALVLSVKPAFLGRFVHKPFPTGSLGTQPGTRAGTSRCCCHDAQWDPRLAEPQRGCMGSGHQGSRWCFGKEPLEKSRSCPSRGQGHLRPYCSDQPGSWGLTSFLGQWVLKMAEGSREAALMLPTRLHPILLLLPLTLCPEHPS